MSDTVYYLYRQWLPNSGEGFRDFPCFFHYFNLIHEVDECALITDISLPVK
ncbi:GyrI-like domain-containing protein [Pseudoalteromonas sp. KAN5]|uniref:GyrI-like domain-containing protein n=1 Tax=Pseudoalteromonas sp. KAN5 TaxID=2916633 RepID=UPI001FCAECCB|nr:GyrI-like domain-containing protein [Pseudoalteromonas sp. KAN5]